MRRTRWSCRGLGLGLSLELGLGLGLVATAGFGQQSAGSGCGGEGGRVPQDYRWDAVLQQRWAVRSDCAHPERPAVAEAVGGVGNPVSARAATERPVLHPGEAVQISMRTGVVQMELAGIAEESGFTGKKVWVRLLPVSQDGAGVQQRMQAVVLGPGAVEVRP